MFGSCNDSEPLMCSTEVRPSNTIACSIMCASQCSVHHLCVFVDSIWGDRLFLFRIVCTACIVSVVCERKQQYYHCSYGLMMKKSGEIHFTDTFIQSDVQYFIFKVYVLLVHAFPGYQTHDLCIAKAVWVTGIPRDWRKMGLKVKVEPWLGPVSNHLPAIQNCMLYYIYIFMLLHLSVHLRACRKIVNI